jgi:hypothetical protein
MNLLRSSLLAYSDIRGRHAKESSQITAFRAQHVQITSTRIAMQHLLNLKGKTSTPVSDTAR